MDHVMIANASAYVYFIIFWSRDIDSISMYNLKRIEYITISKPLAS